MSLPRIFVPSKLISNQKIALDAVASRHILYALRLHVNDPLVVFNNTGGEFEAVISSVDKNIAIISIRKFFVRNNESSLSIHLGQGISRGEKMDFTIQKAVELGVNTITPLFTEHCNVQLKDERLKKRLQHWQSVAVSAAEQSGRCHVPEILPAQVLTKWCASAVLTSDLRLILDPNATNKLGSIAVRPSSVTILVGPEGGLSDKEIELTKQNNFLPISLGPRILRTETTALAAISVLQAKWGDF